MKTTVKEEPQVREGSRGNNTQDGRGNGAHTSSTATYPFETYPFYFPFSV